MRPDSFAEVNQARLAEVLDDQYITTVARLGKASASFLAYLIDRAGTAPIRQLYQVESRDIAQRINALYGRSLEDLERDWRAFCAARR